MRAGGCTVQQALTPEAATMVKQALTLARRRGHAQVTPLHVASAMLQSPTGHLRAACLQSHSHPLQCKALELCFNVALNRLPAACSPAASGLLLSPGHHHPPSLSNALVAAFKRAQAYQRRGSAETQQQPLLAVKIELDQLIISILDDPSISRVMREAGFSSTQVKSNLEQETCPPNPNPNPNPSSPDHPNKDPVLQVQSSNPITRHLGQQVKSGDVMSVIEALVSKRKRSVVVVGECMASTEGVMRGLVDRAGKGEVPEALMGVQFINFPLASFGLMSRAEVELKVGEMRCLVRSCCVVGGRGAVLYLGDLKWAAEYWGSCGEVGKSYCFPTENVMKEIGRLVGSGIRRFWVLGAATYQTYMKCRSGNPSLESLWSLQPITVPTGSLDLSLNFDSDLQSQLQCKISGDRSCCEDFSIKFETAARAFPEMTKNNRPISSNLPSWLQKYKEDKEGTSSDKDCIQLNDLCKKWNSIQNSSQKHQDLSYEKSLHFSYDHRYSGLHQTHQALPVPFNSKQPWGKHSIWIPKTTDHEGDFRPNLRIYSQDHEGQSSSPQHYVDACNPNPNSNSSSYSDPMQTDHQSPRKFKELNSVNLKTLCHALEEAVPWQRDIIPDIASTILQCRSGMMKSSRAKEDTWLFFQGGDVEGKEKTARELAKLIFGSHINFVSIGLSVFSSTRSGDSTDDRQRNKRSRAEVGHGYLDRFIDAVRENPHRVILVEDIEQVDYYSQLVLKTAIERGRIESTNGEEHSFSDAIIILSCEIFDSRSRACSPNAKQKSGSDDDDKEEEAKEEISSCFCLDLNVCVEEGEGEVEDIRCLDDVGLIESVDRILFFKLPNDL